MSNILMLGDSDDIKVVGQLGAYLTKTVRAKQNIGRGFVVPIDKYVGYGMSNEILRIFDEMKLDQVILRASPATARDANETIRKVSRNNLLSTINYMQENAKRRYEPCAIVVQELLDGEFCGKVHSCNIYTGAQDEILIEAKLWANNSVLGDDESAVQESFENGLLEYPQYTQPVEFHGMKVPDVLLSGNHARSRTCFCPGIMPESDSGAVPNPRTRRCLSVRT